MQNARDENSAGFRPIKDNVPAMFVTPKTGTHVIAEASERRIAG